MNKHFFTQALCCFFFIFLMSSLSALEVNQEELKSTGGVDTVVFINYTGPHKKIDSLASIKEIGTTLGTPVAENPSVSSTSGSKNRYYIIHVVDSSEKGKLDADIMYIGSDATIDHIDNVRRILSSYLSSAYNYSSADADAIAVFITVYNAVYRGKIDIFQGKYKNAVTKNLTEDSCGLAISYREWPGKTQIVIPLSDINGGLSAIETSIISDSKVVKSMQKDDGKNIDTRKQMVNIKEREADNATIAAQQKQKQAIEEQKKNDTESQKVLETKQQAVAAQKKAEAAQKDADIAQQNAVANPDDKQAQQNAAEKKQEAEKQQQEANQKKQEAEKQQQEAEKQQQKTDDTKQQAADTQAVADKKQTEAQNERSEIAKDVQTVTTEQAAGEKAPSAYGIQLTDEKHLLSALVKVNTETGEILRQSPVSYIRNRVLFKTSNGYVAIAGENSGNSAVKLVLLDLGSMEIVKTSNETVADNSVLVQDENDFYCIVQDKNNWVVAKYGADMTLKLKSPVAVKSSTPITDIGNMLLVTGADSKVYLLIKKDLTAVSKSNTKTVTTK
jgi:hypothetical protein